MKVMLLELLYNNSMNVPIYNMHFWLLPLEPPAAHQKN